jgi:hypothetical protein
MKAPPCLARPLLLATGKQGRKTQVRERHMLYLGQHQERPSGIGEDIIKAAHGCIPVGRTPFIMKPFNACRHIYAVYQCFGIFHMSIIAQRLFLGIHGFGEGLLDEAG